MVSVNSSDLHSKKRHRLAASCGSYRLATSCQQVATRLLTSSSCIKSVKIRRVATRYFQTFCKLQKQKIEAGLLQRARFWPCNSTMDVASMAIKSEA